MTDQKKPRLFIRNPDSGESWAFCGTLTGGKEDTLDLQRAFGCFLEGEVNNDFGGAHPGNLFTVEVKRELMTDAEVEALPEM